MSKLIKISALAKAGFFRCGRHWPHEGVILDAASLDADVGRRLAADPNLRIEPAPEGATAQDAEADAEGLRRRLKFVIANLPADAFGANGAPNLGPIREASLTEDAARITGALRDEVWAELQAARTQQPNE